MRFINYIKNYIKVLQEKNKFLKYLLNKYAVATLIFLIFMVFVDLYNIPRLMYDNYEIYKQNVAISKYKNSIRETDERLKELRSNRDSLEKFAREKYYFHEKDEDVFIVVE